MSKFSYSIETERLIVRPLTKEDYSSWFNGFDSRLPSKHRHDQGRMDMDVCTPEWFGGLVDKHQKLAEDDKAYIFAVFAKTDGSHLGMVDFSTLERGEFQWGRIGYSIHNHLWGKGFGSEAVRGAQELAFKDLGYHRIEAHINLDNQASVKLAESAGLEFECIRKGFIYEFGEWTDNQIYYINSGM